MGTDLFTVRSTKELLLAAVQRDGRERLTTATHNYIPFWHRTRIDRLKARTLRESEGKAKRSAPEEVTKEIL